MFASLSITTSVQRGFDSFFGYLPNVLGFLVILVVGYIIARIVRTIVTKVLAHLRMDDALNRAPAGQYVDRVSPGGRPSRLVGAIVFWFIFLYVLTAALGALDIPAVTAFVNQVLAYLPNVIAAVVIFVVAAVISGGVVAAIRQTMGETPTGRIAQAVVPGLVMVIAVFMILNQLGIASTIVTITYRRCWGCSPWPAPWPSVWADATWPPRSSSRPTPTTKELSLRPAPTCRPERSERNKPLGNRRRRPATPVHRPHRTAKASCPLFI